MATHNKSHSAAIHDRLSHPVVDCDGHWVEYAPAFFEYVRETIGSDAPERFKRLLPTVAGVTPPGFEERLRRRMPQSGWWVMPSRNTLDRATAMAPGLMYERLGEMGLDVVVLYPTLIGTLVPFVRDEEMRRGGARAFNLFAKEMFGAYSDRLLPAAGIPMHTPQEAIEELEFVKQQGFKAVMLSGLISRQAEGRRFWRDPLGLDSEHDYDPVWAKCQELGLAPTFHNQTQGFGFRTAVSNWVYNHIGHFAAGGEAMCKALFLGGVTRRFPKLKFSFLEGGGAWACSLYNDLIRHWKTRNVGALENVNPANLNRDELADLLKRYGNPRMRRCVERTGVEDVQLNTVPPDIDEFARCAIERAEDIRDLFVPNFYFGCEAEDSLNAWAFNGKINPFGARLNVVLGSDISHFDVTDMSEVLAEAHELVDEGLLGEADFKDLTFSNAVRFFGGVNPNFFEGTAVEKAAAELLASH
jgi:predicted TIM-barrel fold metal-dependent hydrolase